MRDLRGTKRHVGLFIFVLPLATAFMLVPGKFATAQLDAEIDILIGSASGEPGSKVDIDVDLETNDAEPSVIVLTLLYDATKLSFVEVVRGESAIQAEKLVDINNQPGELGVVIWGGRTVLEDGNVFTVTFTIRSATSPQVLNIAGDGLESAVDVNATRILVVVDPGSITVKEPDDDDIFPRCGGRLDTKYFAAQNGSGTAETPQADAGIFLALAATLGMKYAGRWGKKK
jgi:hypothetical protein